MKRKETRDQEVGDMDGMYLRSRALYYITKASSSVPRAFCYLMLMYVQRFSNMIEMCS